MRRTTGWGQFRRAMKISGKTLLFCFVVAATSSGAALAVADQIMTSAQLDESGQINLSAGDYQLIQTPTRLVQTFSDKPQIVRQVVLSSRKVAMLASAPGTGLFGFLDENNLAAVRVMVSQFKETNGKPAPVRKQVYSLSDLKERKIAIKAGQWCELEGTDRFLKARKPIVIDDPAVVEVQYSGPNRAVFLAKQPGNTAVHFNDGSSKVDLQLQVASGNKANATSVKLARKDRAAVYRDVTTYMSTLNFDKKELKTGVDKLSQLAREKAHQIETSGK